MNRLLSLLTLTALISLPLSAPALWEDATGDPGGWKESDWFGWFSSWGYGAGWLYHQEHGWMWCIGETPSSVWVWSEARGWWWICQEDYPVVFDMERGWGYYERGSSDPRWFYWYDRGAWERDGDAISGGLETYQPLRGMDTIWWTYGLSNDGRVNYEEDGLHIQMQFEQLRVTAQGSPPQLGYLMQGHLSGSDSDLGAFSGEATLDLGAHFRMDPHRALVVGSWQIMDLTMYTNHGTIRLRTEATGDQEPVEDLATRPDFDILPIGFVVQNEQTLTFDLSLQAYLNGSLLEQDFVQETQWHRSSTTITDHLDSMTVNGRTYYDVIAVETWTDGTTPAKTWYAKGIGAIRVEAFEVIDGQRLSFDLLDSNLIH